MCDDFETGVGSAWTVLGQITPTAMAHTGSGALLAHLDAVGAGGSAISMIREGTSFANQSGTTFWARAWIQLDSLPVSGNALQITEADELDGTIGDAVVATPLSTAVTSQYAGQSMIALQPLVIGPWQCVIWQVNLSPGAGGTLDLSGDAPTLHLDVATDGVPPVGLLGIGLDFPAGSVVSDNGAMNMWIDDVVVDDQPVACN